MLGNDLAGNPIEPGARLDLFLDITERQNFTAFGNLFNEERSTNHVYIVLSRRMLLFVGAHWLDRLTYFTPEMMIAFTTSPHFDCIYSNGEVSTSKVRVFGS